MMIFYPYEIDHFFISLMHKRVCHLKFLEPRVTRNLISLKCVKNKRVKFTHICARICKLDIHINREKIFYIIYKYVDINCFTAV